MHILNRYSPRNKLPSTPNPELARELIWATHHVEREVSSQEIDQALYGFAITTHGNLLYQQLGGSANDARREALYGTELLWLQCSEQYWTPYAAVRALIKNLRPNANDVVYDLGSGYGRVCIYGAVTSPAEFKGIEILKERVPLAQEAADRLNLSDVSFQCANVLDVDFSDGNIFYMWAPFSGPTRDLVLSKLREIGEDKHIQVIYRGSREKMAKYPWLKQIGLITEPDSNYPMNVYTVV